MKEIKDKIPRYKTKLYGECKQCGSCCRDIQLDMRTDLKYPEQFLRTNFDKIIKEMVGTHIKGNPHLDFSKCNEIKFYAGCDDTLICHIYGVQCKALKKQDNGKYLCSIHDNKPGLCETYPEIDSIFPKGCGYFKRKVKMKDGKD